MIDFNLDEGYPIVTDDVKHILQQIDILFDTKPGEVLGNISYGTNYSSFLYNLQMSNYDIKQIITNDIYTLDLRGFQFNVNVALFAGTENDIILVQIIFYKGNEYFEKTIKITN